MSGTGTATRRSFLKFGALAAAPLAAPAAAMVAGDDAAARLARHEDEAAIRDLHRAWLNRDDGHALQPGIRRIAADHAAEPAIELAADGRRAEGRFPCLVAFETELPRDNTLAQMAHAQGNSLFTRDERRTLKADYVKTGEGWTIARMTLLPA